MQQTHGRVWYFFSDDVPDGELMIPILNEYGLAFAVKPNAGMTQEMLDELNRVADHVMGVGIAHLEVGVGLVPS
ncbi:hypothetical protein [Streptomyces sp. YIM B13518]|uniref:hypothetical protein n=1 Tax=Streptomyces sp. YIM B13518 TaxID=3366316 RepID=UPI00368A8492